MTPFFCTLRRFPAPVLLAVVIWATLARVAPCARAEGLKSAQVSRVFNDVRLLPENQPARPAAVADTVTGKAAVQTGTASRTELTFSDRTLTRLGANSYFSFVNGTRDMDLGNGTMLLQVPKDAGGATIHTAAVTAAITGTTLMVEYNPKSYSKIIVLEGTVRVYLTGRVGESVLVHAGEMVIVAPTAKTMPEPVSLDLRILYETSGLIRDFGSLASTKLIDREIGRQKKQIDGGVLESTESYIVGRGTAVQSGNLSYVSETNERITAGQGAHAPLGLEEARKPATAPTPVIIPTPTATPIITPTATPIITPSATPITSPTATPIITPTATPIITPTATPIITPTATPIITPTATPVVSPTATPIITPTATPIVSPTATPIITPTATPIITPTATPIVTPTATPIVTPTATPIVTPTATPIVTPTATPVVTPTATPIVTPTTTPIVTPTATPIVTPTATPIVTPTVTPTPSPTLSPSPTPSPTPTIPPTSKYGPLPLIVGNDPGDSTRYNLDGTSVILTDPFITTGGVQDAGRIYRGGSVASPSGATSIDGLPSTYLLGATTGPGAFDQQINFDTRFGSIGDIGALRFGNLAILAAPASISPAGGPANLALIADGQITDGSPTNTTSQPPFSLNGLGNVLIATRDGAITFNRDIVFQNDDDTSPNLTFYARGGGLDLGENVGVSIGGALVLFSDTGITINATVGTGSLAGAGTVQLVSGGGITIGGSVYSSDDFTASTTKSGGGTTGGDFIVTQSGRFGSVFGAGSVSASGNVMIDGVAGTDGALQVTAGGSLTAGMPSILQSEFGAVTLTAGTTLSLNGYVSASSGLSLTAGSDVTLGGFINLSGSVFTVRTPGAVNINGTVSGNETFASPDGTVPGSYFSVHGSNVTVADGASIAAGGDITQASDLTATGNLVLNGTASAYVGKLLLNSGGDFTAGAKSSIVANLAIIDAQGVVTLDLASFQPFDPTQNTRLSITGQSAVLSNSADADPSPLVGVDVTTTAGPISLAAGDYLFTSVQTTAGATAAAPGDLTLSDGANLTLSGPAASHVRGNVNLGSVTVGLNGPLTVDGKFAVGDAASQTADLNISTNPGLTAAGNIDLGTGHIVGGVDSAVNTGGTLNAGTVLLQSLNAAGDISVAQLTVQKLTTNLLDGSANPTLTTTTVSGTVYPFADGGQHTFDVGRFTADGGLQFGAPPFGGTTAYSALDSASLTLTAHADINFGPSDGPGESVTTASFDGEQSTATTAAPVAGRGGNLTVNATPVTAGGTPVNVNIQYTTLPRPSPSPAPYTGPALTAEGGYIVAVTSGTGASGGAGGTLKFTASGAVTVANGASLNVQGGGLSVSNLPTGFLSAAGGMGGAITLQATGDVAVTGLSGYGLYGPVFLGANGGAVGLESAVPNATGGTGGTISLSAGGIVNASYLNAEAEGGSVSQYGSKPMSFAGGNGGIIEVSSTGSTLTVPDITLYHANLLANTGSNSTGTAFGGIGGTVAITSADTANQSFDTDPAAVQLTNANITVSNTNGANVINAAAKGGTIQVTSARTSGPGIQIDTNSNLVAQVASTSTTYNGAPTGGSITVQTAGANIVVDTSTIQASGPTSLVLVNSAGVQSPGGLSGFTPASSLPTTTAPTISLNDATLSADVLKVQALGNNVTLRIGGSSVLTGSSQLLLYAGNGTNTGLIEFVANTSITTGATVAGVLAANTIRIDPSVTVTVTGQALQLYGNSLQFTGSGGDGTTSGTFAGSGAAKAGTFAQLPSTAQPTTTTAPTVGKTKGPHTGLIAPAAGKIIARINPTTVLVARPATGRGVNPLPAFANVSKPGGVTQTVSAPTRERRLPKPTRTVRTDKMPPR